MIKALPKVALLIEPDESHRVRFSTALTQCNRFTRVSSAQSVSDAKALIEGEVTYTHIFLSSKLTDKDLTEFIGSAKSIGVPPKFALVAMLDTDLKRKVIEKGCVINADAIIFGPHTNEAVNAVVESLEQSDKPLGPLSPITLLISEIIRELDSMSGGLNVAEKTDVGFKIFGQRLSVLKQLSEGDLENYLAMALDIFINSSSPQKTPARGRKRSYTGASQRVRQMIDEYNSRG